MRGHIVTLLEECEPLYYIPVRIHGDYYSFHVDTNFVRNFTKEDLPDTLLARLAMLYAMKPDDLKPMTINPPLVPPVFEHPMRDSCPSLVEGKDGYEDVGFWLHSDWFFLCVETAYLRYMKGI